MTRRRALLSLFLVCAACGDTETGPNVPTSLQFDALPFPAVVAGDTLRDTSGIATPLRALVFNSDNAEILDAPVRYAALENVVIVDSISGHVVAGSNADTSARLIAFIGALQSPPLRLRVVPRPDSVARSGTIDTLRYSVTDTTVNVSGDLAVRVIHRGLPDRNVRDWIVAFTLQNPGDSVRARILDDSRRRSNVDTTSTDGTAARKVRLLPAGLTATSDSVIVLAHVRYRGAHVAGSPVRLVLHYRPRS